jgi:hypothetical protein
MNSLGRWSLVVAVLAGSGWAWLCVSPDPVPAAINRTSTAAEQPALGSPTEPAFASGPAAAQDWVARFPALGSDYFEFVTAAARAAYDGDGAAQYYIGRALSRCEETNALYRDADNADQAVAHLASLPAMLELERQEYLNCRKFLSENPFRDLPERPGGYPAAYWQARALESRYPVALVEAALDSPGTYTPEQIASALATGNADAMLLYGWSQAPAAEATGATPIMAAAWVLAACRSGANCGPTNAVVPLGLCSAGIDLGCTERATAIDELTARLGSQDLDEANLLAQDIQGSMRFRDPARLMKFLPF